MSGRAVWPICWSWSSLGAGTVIVIKVGAGAHSVHHTAEVIHPGGGGTSDGGIVEAQFVVDVAVS